MTERPGPPFQWDENKSQGNLQMRGFGFELIHHFDWSTAVTQQDLRTGEEQRWVSVGLIEGRLYVTVWTQRGAATRIISLRKANDREVDKYERARA